MRSFPMAAPVVLGLAFGCGSGAKRARLPATPSFPQASETEPAAEPAATTGYLPSTASLDDREKVAAFADESGSLADAGVVSDGIRISSRLSPRLGVANDPHLLGGMRLAKKDGGGFLFWTAGALWRAREFLGELVPVAATSGSVLGVADHPKGPLFRFSDGSRAVFESGTFRRLPVSLEGIVDVRSLADGRAVALLSGGGVRASRDAGATWFTPAPAPRVPATRVERHMDSLRIDLSDGTTFRLGTDGSLVAAPARNKVTESRTVPAIERVVATGLLIDPASALVYEEEKLWAIALPSGEALWAAPIPVDRGSRCELVRGADQKELLICAANSGRSVGGSVFSGLRTGHPTLEMRLPEGPWPLATAYGVIAWDGGCGPLPAPGHVCVRGPDGQWLEGDVAAPHSSGAMASRAVGDAGVRAVGNAGVRAVGNAGARAVGNAGARTVGNAGAGHPRGAAAAAHAAADSPAASGRRTPARGPRPVVPAKTVGASGPLVRRWIPSAGGEVLAWMESGPPIRVDTRAGTADPMAGPGYRGYEKDANRVPSRKGDRLLERDWRVDADGHVWGSLPDEVVDIDPDRGVLPIGRAPGTLTWAGARALACQSPGQWWQTLDFGLHWAPLAAKLPSQTTACSEVGCTIGPVVRLGWQAEPAAPLTRPFPAVSDTSAFVRAGAPPRIVCERSGELRRRFTRVSDSSGADPLFGLGAHLLARRGGSDVEVTEETWHPSGDASPDIPVALLAAYRSSSQRDGGLVTRALRAEWISAFDVQARIRSTSFTVNALSRAAAQAGLTLEDVQTSTTVAAPVLDAPDIVEAGQLVTIDSGQLLFLHSRPQSTRPYFLGTESDGADGLLASAVALDSETLAVLLAGDDAYRIVLAKTRGPRLYWRVPTGPSTLDSPNPPALAVTPKNELALLYTPSGSEPASATDPAVLLRRSGALERLAPWSTLKPASAAECTPSDDDYRAILGTATRWVDVVDASVPVSEKSGMYASVRWNGKRVCLVAIETLLASAELGIDQPSPVRLAARFDTGEGMRMAVGQGYESRQAMTCRLESM